MVVDARYVQMLDKFFEVKPVVELRQIVEKVFNLRELRFSFFPFIYLFFFATSEQNFSVDANHCHLSSSALQRNDN